MDAAVLLRPGVVEITRRPIPELQPDDVLVRVASVGICGSDAHYYAHGRIGRYVVKDPLVLGHECSGELVEVGANVDRARIGDRVAIEPGIPCRRCRECKAGRYNLCRDVAFMATPPSDGALAQYVAVPSDFAHRIPDHVSLEDAALIEPVAVGVHAARRGGVGPGARCAIFGAGPVGLLLLQVLRAFGATAVAVADPQSARLELARELGADVGLDPRSQDYAAALAKFAPAGVDAAFDASGNAQALVSTVQAARRGGRVVWIGLPVADLVPLPAAMVIDKEVDLFGVFRYANAHPLAIELVASGLVRTHRLISHRLRLVEAGTALQLVAGHEPGVVKVVVEPSKN